MANYTTSLVIKSVTITLEDITMETYNKIIAYIDSLDKPVDEPKVEQPKDDPKKRELSKGPGSDRPRSKPEVKWTEFGYGNRELLDYLKYADEHPDKFDWKWMRPAEWVKTTEIADKYTNKSLSRRLGNIAFLGWLESKHEYVSNDGLEKPWFKLPVKKEPYPVAVSTKSEEPNGVDPVQNYNEHDAEMGSKLRKARNESGLNLLEMSKAIGYGADVIGKWELGVFTMSKPAIEAINKFFCRDIFASA